MFNLTGKIALVTGSTSGIGKAAAIALAKQGATVIVSGRRESEGESVVKEIIANGGTAKYLSADITNPSEVSKLFQQSMNEYGKLDILFLNAGVFGYSSIEDQSHENLDEQINLNLKGTYFCIQEAKKHLVQGARIVINTSIIADLGVRGTSVYSMTKGGLNSLTRASAVEFAPLGIRVNAVAPGPTFTNENPLESEKIEFQKAIEGFNVMNRYADPKEIAAAVVFLASDEASYITGHVLAVDGGSAIH